MAKGEIAYDEQFYLWPQCFQLYFTIMLSFMEIFQVFVTMFSKSSAADLLYVGKGKCNNVFLGFILLTFPPYSKSAADDFENVS